jgi:exopolyphosphatase / guanosine-5'-triphosphate,3'-diphosphate pyrophosphatase
LVRLAAIDIGTNTVRLLVSDVTAEGAKTDVVRRAAITRLGEGLVESGMFKPEAVVRTLETLAAYSDETGKLGVEAIKVVATSAARDASNSGEFLAAAGEVLGTSVDVVSGETEAAYAFLGAVQAFPFKDPEQQVVVFDVGGGSTELIAGRGRYMDTAVSLDIGSVRLTELFVRNDPPAADEINQINEWVRDAVKNGLKKAGMTTTDNLTVIGVAGTITTIKAVRIGLSEYDPAKIHVSKLTREDVVAVLNKFLSMRLADRQKLAGLEPKRADVIIAGTIITAMVLDELGAKELTVSESDIIDGTLLTLAEEVKSE